MQTRKTLYNIYVDMLMESDSINNRDYYRKYVCEMDQGFQQSVIDSLPKGVKAKKIDDIWYFDYTDAFDKLLQDGEKVVQEHYIPSFEDYIEATNKNLTWLGQLFYDYNSAYQGKVIGELLWYKSMVEPYAVWDIKVKENWEAIFGKGSFYGNQFKFVFDNTIVTPEVMGNVTYGYWGKALGASDEMLYFGGGVANAGWKLWNLLKPYYGENKADHDAVERGIKYYHEKHKKA